MKLLPNKKTIGASAGAAVGAVASGIAAKYIPIADEKIKSAAVMAVGLILSGQKGFISNVGLGMVAGGALGVAKSFGIAGLADYDAEAIEGIFEDTTEALADEVLAGDEDVLEGYDEEDED